MMYKRLVCSPFILFITSLKLISTNEEVFDKYNFAPNLERTVSVWNRSYENGQRSVFPEEEIFERSDFFSEMNKCIEEHRNQITENLTQGKNVILNCFKATLMLHVVRYLGESPKTSYKLFNGLLEFEKIQGNIVGKCGEENCDEKHDRRFGTFQKKKNEYLRMYKKAMQKLLNERNRSSLYRNQTEEEKASQLRRINENSQLFLSEVIRNLGNEDAEKAEEEKLKREIADPKLLWLLDALTRNYMLRFRFYPGVTGRMLRNDNGGFTFDLEIQDSEEEPEEEGSSDDSLTREIKDGPQAKDYFDDDDDDGVKKKFKEDKKKKKQMKKKAKKLKKIIPYLLLPMLIQMTLLPFVFKKLFFLAMKALFAGKVALILVGFNLLRNTCIKNDDDYNQKIRVEHYGYRRGEEYGAWINGKSFQEPAVGTALHGYM